MQLGANRAMSVLQVGVRAVYNVLLRGYLLSSSAECVPCAALPPWWAWLVLLSPMFPICCPAPLVGMACAPELNVSHVLPCLMVGMAWWGVCMACAHEPNMIHVLPCLMCMACDMAISLDLPSCSKDPVTVQCIWHMRTLSPLQNVNVCD